MTTIGTKTRFSSGVGRQRETGVDDRLPDRLKLDAKRLAKSEASLAECERMLLRQTALLAELRADGLVTTEAEKSVMRLEAALLARRSAHDCLAAQANPND